jgi:microcystin-dependent protein
VADFDFPAAPGGDWPSITAPTSEQNAITSGTLNAVTNFITTVTPSPVPPGVMTPYGGSSAPSGWLLCDGSAVSRTTYADLYAAISTTFGVGDGSTTFNLPNLQDRFPVGKGSTLSTLGATGGSLSHTHGQTQHQHDFSSVTGGHSHAFSGGGSHNHTWSNSFTTTGASAGPAQGGSGTPTDVTRIAHTHSGSVSGSTSTSSASISGTTDTVSGSISGTSDFDDPSDTDGANPPYQVVNYIIKT